MAEASSTVSGKVDPAESNVGPAETQEDNLEALLSPARQSLACVESLAKSLNLTAPTIVNSTVFHCVENYSTEFRQLVTELNRRNAQTFNPVLADAILELRLRFDSLSLLFLTSSTENTPSISTHKSIELPKLKIQVFDGEQSAWPQFKNLFESSVHRNSSLNRTQKFQFLLGLLKGNSLKLIESLHVSDENYEIAFRILCDRYDNPRLVANHYFNQIVGFDGTANPSLNHFLGIHVSSTQALKAMNIDLADFLLMQMCLSNLPEEERRDFERLSESPTLPTLADLLEFVNRRARAEDLMRANVLNLVQEHQLKTQLASSPTVVIPEPPVSSSTAFRRSFRFPPPVSSPSRHQVSITPPPSGRGSGRGAIPKTLLAPLPPKTDHDLPPAQQSTERPPSKEDEPCFFCHKAHRIYRCLRFAEATLDERYDAAKRAARCFGCLGRHSRKYCLSNSRCTQCGLTTHHSLLCHKNVKPAGKEPSSEGPSHA